MKQVESLAPINIASVVLECHREDEDQGHVEGYYRGCEARHEALRWVQINIPGSTADIHFNFQEEDQ